MTYRVTGFKWSEPKHSQGITRYAGCYEASNGREGIYSVLILSAGQNNWIWGVDKLFTNGKYSECNVREGYEDNLNDAKLAALTALEDVIEQRSLEEAEKGEL